MTDPGYRFKDETDDSERISGHHGMGSSLAELKSWTRDIFFAALTAILIVVFVVQAGEGLKGPACSRISPTRKGYLSTSSSTI